MKDGIYGDVEAYTKTYIVDLALKWTQAKWMYFLLLLKGVFGFWISFAHAIERHCFSGGDDWLSRQMFDTFFLASLYYTTPLIHTHNLHTIHTLYYGQTKSNILKAYYNTVMVCVNIFWE